MVPNSTADGWRPSRQCCPGSRRAGEQSGRRLYVGRDTGCSFFVSTQPVGGTIIGPITVDATSPTRPSVNGISCTGCVPVPLVGTGSVEWVGTIEVFIGPRRRNPPGHCISRFVWLHGPSVASEQTLSPTATWLSAYRGHRKWKGQRSHSHSEQSFSPTPNLPRGELLRAGSSGQDWAAVTPPMPRRAIGGESAEQKPHQCACQRVDVVLEAEGSPSSPTPMKRTPPSLFTKALAVRLRDVGDTERALNPAR